MTRTDDNNSPLSLDTQIDEDRVRRALGLKSSAPHQQRPEQARQRHRFIADGAVPVVVLNRSDVETVGLRERLAALETTLENERHAHAATRRAFQDLTLNHQALQTRLQHNEMARADALRAEREARLSAEHDLAAVRRELAEQPRRVRRIEAEPETAVLSESVEPAPLRPEPPVTPAIAAPTITAPIAAIAVQAIRIPAKRGRKPRLEAPAKEEKPVRWWTPSYRAKNGR